MYEFGTSKPVEVILKKRQNDGGDEPNWGTFYAYMEIS
jgi:hypothetical protein